MDRAIEMISKISKIGRIGRAGDRSVDCGDRNVVCGVCFFWHGLLSAKNRKKAKRKKDSGRIGEKGKRIGEKEKGTRKRNKEKEQGKRNKEKEQGKGTRKRNQENKAKKNGEPSLGVLCVFVAVFPFPFPSLSFPMVVMSALVELTKIPNTDTPLAVFDRHHHDTTTNPQPTTHTLPTPRHPIPSPQPALSPLQNSPASEPSLAR
jgi:hypothetical protein